ncbi:NEDD8-conjugating enzyme UBC12 [Zancudomyces culisetae]|uniref:NEDD8-conjugating enzyme UBC12 n=1 Tax=Zancudomyces culisetae TaxID=1213189 RepID=A0A1R1PWJ8_ZANCU|nr:NEDD8-conjugating enzyme UBC12 [Zancudomyces culisetae]|eukprot:OMH85252.1 NEDD8-conjugating enzyme UBC12 [Zancudomyces culisetae]
MLNVWKLKKKQAEEKKTKSNVSAALIRIQKDVSELDLPNTIKIDFPNPEDLCNFEVIIEPDEGMYIYQHILYA